MFVLLKLIQMEYIKNDFFEEPLHMFEGVFKFKSISRAIRRGHMNMYGIIFPKRPFSNSKNKSKRLNKHSKN